jgi:hypothetical protein
MNELCCAQKVFSHSAPHLDFSQAWIGRTNLTCSTINVEDKPMSTSATQPSAQERVPMMQRVLDNPFLLLFLGVTIPTVLYLLWGVMELASIPLAK